MLNKTVGEPFCQIYKEGKMTRGKSIHLTIDDVRKVKESIKIGDTIKMEQVNSDSDDGRLVVVRSEPVTAVRKYPYIVKVMHLGMTKPTYSTITYIDIALQRRRAGC